MAAVEREVWVPEILRWGRRGVRVKIWTFLYLNRPDWFTAQEISEHLDTPLSTVHVALKDLRRLPRIVFRDRERPGKGRREKMYSFRRAVQPSRNTSL